MNTDMNTMNVNTTDTDTAGPAADTAPAATTAPFQIYDAKLAPQDSTTKRVAKCLYRAPEKGAPVLHTNSYVMVPMLDDKDIVDNIDVLMPHIAGYLCKVQDDIIKAAHKAGATEIAYTACSLAAIIDKLEESGQGKLNKEQVFAWFDSLMADKLMMLFGEKLGITAASTEAEIVKLDAILGAYKAQYGALAGGNSTFHNEAAQKLLDAIVACNAQDSRIGARFVARLGDMLKPAEDLLLGL